MRTTFDLSNEQRAGLLALAARRGLRGYSLLIQEALTRYLRLPKSPAQALVRRPKLKQDLLSFVSDGFSTKRRDGSLRHDDYIYRNG